MLATVRTTGTRRGLVTVAAVLLYVAVVARVVTGPYERAGALLALHLVIILTTAILPWLLAREPDPWIRRLIVIALFVKLVGTMLRYYVAFDVYEGDADAAAYSAEGAVVAGHLRDGDLRSVIGAETIAGTDGTRFIEILTGGAFAFIGNTTQGGFLVFSWMSFWGSYLIYRGFRTAHPEQDGRRYAALLLLLPSMVFWPSSIGKEAWMLLAIGIATYGAARMFTGAVGGIPLAALGVATAAVVRPHVAIALVVATVIAHTVARHPAAARQKVTLTRGVVLVLAFIALAGLMTRTAQFLKVGEANPVALASALDYASKQTTSGGSSFQPVAARSPIDIPVAAFSVLFRPLIVEAGSLLSAGVSLEGTFLLVMAVRSRARLRAALRSRSPFVIFSFLFLLLFVIAFSHVGNFGILARQRVQVLPFVLVPMAFFPVGRYDRVGPSRPPPVPVGTG